MSSARAGSPGLVQGLTQVEEGVPGLRIEADGGLQVFDPFPLRAARRQQGPQVVVGAGEGRFQLDGLAVAPLGAGHVPRPSRATPDSARRRRSRARSPGPCGRPGRRRRSVLAQRGGSVLEVLPAAGVQRGDLIEERIGERHPPLAIGRESRPRLVEPPQLAVGGGEGGADFRGPGLALERGLEVAGGGAGVPRVERHAAEAEVGRRRGAGGGEGGLEGPARLGRPAELEPDLAQADQGRGVPRPAAPGRGRGALRPPRSRRWPGAGRPGSRSSGRRPGRAARRSPGRRGRSR